MNGLIPMQECGIGPKDYQPPPARSILTERKLSLEKALAEVSEALEFLDKNPTFEEGLRVLSKGLR